MYTCWHVPRKHTFRENTQVWFLNKPINTRTMLYLHNMSAYYIIHPSRHLHPSISSSIHVYPSIQSLASIHPSPSFYPPSHSWIVLLHYQSQLLVLILHPWIMQLHKITFTLITQHFWIKKKQQQQSDNTVSVCGLQSYLLIYLSLSWCVMIAFAL